MEKQTVQKLFLLVGILLFSLAFVSAGELRVTNEHPFLIDGKWISASELSVGDEMTTVDGRRVRISRIESVEEDVEVYNLEAGVYHDFVVCGEDNCSSWVGSLDDLMGGGVGVVVHNSNPPGSNYPCNGIYANCPLKNPGKKYPILVPRSELINGVDPILDEFKIATWIAESPDDLTRMAREKYVNILRNGKISFSDEEMQLIIGLNDPVIGINALIKDGGPYGIILGRGSGKSGNYIAQMAKPYLSKAPSIETYINSQTVMHPNGIIRDAIENHGIRRFVIFDDVSYTGTELNHHFVRPFNSMDLDGPLEIIIDVPYITDRARWSILESVTNPHLTVKFAPHKKIKNVLELFTPNERRLLGLADKDVTLTYTDWKIPDAISFDLGATKLFQKNVLDYEDLIPYKRKSTVYSYQEQSLFEDTERYLNSINAPNNFDAFLLDQF